MKSSALTRVFGWFIVIIVVIAVLHRISPTLRAGVNSDYTGIEGFAASSAFMELLKVLGIILGVLALGMLIIGVGIASFGNL